MKKVIIKVKGIFKNEELERLHFDILRDLNRDGFVVLDEKFEIAEFDDGEEESNGEL